MVLSRYRIPVHYYHGISQSVCWPCPGPVQYSLTSDLLETRVNIIPLYVKSTKCIFQTKTYSYIFAELYTIFYYRHYLRLIGGRITYAILIQSFLGHKYFLCYVVEKRQRMCHFESPFHVIVERSNMLAD
jgi:hypothetical protein